MDLAGVWNVSHCVDTLPREVVPHPVAEPPGQVQAFLYVALRAGECWN